LMVQVKISGIKKAEDAQWAVNLGADMVSFIFIKQDLRYVSEELAKRMITALPPFVFPVGVFADALPDEIRKSIKRCGLKMVQLNGTEDPGYCAGLRQLLTDFKDLKIIKHFKIADASSIDQIQAFRKPQPVIDYIMADALRESIPGTTAPAFNWELAEKVKTYGPVILTGGLTPENIEQAIETVAPYGVDVMEGVEKTPRTASEQVGIGRKDYDKMKDFIKKAKSFL